MNNLRKMIKALTVMAVITVLIVFAVNVVSENSAPLQSPKPVNTSVKAVKKSIITPSRACSFLDDLDMPTKNYQNVEQSGPYGKYEADSFNFLLETRDSDRFNNNLSYSVFGDKYIARAVELVLNVNDMSFCSNAVNELIKYSDYLMYKVTNKHLTPEIKKAMLAKNKGQWVINGYKIKLEKEIFPEEKPIKGVEPTSDHGAFSLMFIIEL